MLASFNHALWGAHDLLSPLGSLKVELITADDEVVLKGVSPAERSAASPGHVRGLLRITVKRLSIPLDSINIQLVGESVDSFYQPLARSRQLLKVKREIINEAFRYSIGNSRLLKGVYVIPFQFVLDPCLPESIDSIFCQRRYAVKVLFNTKTKLHPLVCQKKILVKRSPVDDSTYFNDMLETSGKWHGVLPYNVSLSSRVCQLGGTIGINLETSPDPTSSFAAVVRFLRVTLVQKLKYPELGADGKLNGKHSTFPAIQVLKYEHFGEERDPYEPFKLNWSVKLPPSLGNFHAYTSNLDSGERSSYDGVHITHMLYVTFGLTLLSQADISSQEEFELDVSRSSSMESNTSSTSQLSSGTSSTLSTAMSEKFDVIVEKGSEVTFRAPIFVVSGNTSSDPPPVYKGDGEEPAVPKSFAWLCSNGKYEVEHPPAYEK